MSNISKVIADLVAVNPKILLDAKQLVKEMADKIPAESLQEFMLFQKTIRDVSITPVIFSADNGSDIVKATAKEKAMKQMLDVGVEKSRAEYTLAVLEEALGWNNNSVIPEQSADDRTTGMKDELNSEITSQPVSQVGNSVIQSTPPEQETGDNTAILDKLKGNQKKYIAVAVTVLVVIIGIVAGKSLTDGKSIEEPKQKFAVQAAKTKKVPDMLSDLSLGGIDLGISLDDMHKRLGQEKASKQEKQLMYYFYDGMKIEVMNNQVYTLISENDTVSTKRGIHQGSNFNEMVKAYGKGYTELKYENLMLYEYAFKSLDGQKGLLRFAIDIGTSRVDYISVRVIDKQAEKFKETNVIDVVYSGGKQSNLILSKDDLTIHVGQRIYLYPKDNSGDAGKLRMMTNQNGINPHGCLTVKGVGVRGDKGSNTEMIITANAVGEGMYTVVPNYGDWKHAAKFHIKVIE